MSAPYVGQQTASGARQVVRSLSVDAAKTVVHAFISLCLDYCNSLLIYCISDILLRHLPAVQNAAARLVIMAPEGVTCEYLHHPVFLLQLRWLPVRQLAVLSVLVDKALNYLAPQYLSDDCFNHRTFQVHYRRRGV